MRVLKAALTATVSAAVISLMAGCSGNGSSIQSIAPHPQMHSANRLNGTGVPARNLSLLRLNIAQPRIIPNSTTPPHRLAVSDFGTGGVEILNSAYALKKTITSGLLGPDGDWYDQLGNLYVADYANAVVQEYTPTGSSPHFTYSSGLGDPIAVTTDELGNVFVGDYLGGFVNEYAQGSNTVINTCAPGGAVESIAVGETGKVFVAYNNSSGTANIAEYATGLAGCHEKVLHVSLTFAGGMQMANNRALVVCDQLGPTIDIINPPYTTINSTIAAGYGDPFHVALNKSNGLMFVADVAFGIVWVQDYPSGAVVTTLGSGSGLVDPAGVASFPFQH